MYKLPLFMQVILRWLINHGQHVLAGKLYGRAERAVTKWTLLRYDLEAFKSAEPHQRWALIWMRLIDTFGKTTEKEVDCDGISWRAYWGGLYYYVSNWSGVQVIFTWGRIWFKLYDAKWFIEED